VNQAVSQYASDLQNEGYSTLVYRFTSGTATSLRNYLATRYRDSEKLTGAVLIGNIPYIVYEMMQDWGYGGGREYDDFPCDLFYMDLDGTWTDTLSDETVQPDNGKYDTRTGNLDLEIWVGRIKTNTLSNLSNLGNESALINSYLAKIHEFRTGTLVTQNRALVYNDDDWGSLTEEDVSDLSDVFGSQAVTGISDAEQTTATDFKQTQLPQSTRWYLIRSHGSPEGHGFYRQDKASFEWVYTSDYTRIDPPASFFSFYVCSGCDYTAGNYLAGIAVFNPQSKGVFAIGSTKTGGMWLSSFFYTPLAQGESLGESFRQWFNQSQTSEPVTSPRYHYGMVMSGDPTLHTTVTITPTPTPTPSPTLTPTSTPTPSPSPTPTPTSTPTSHPTIAVSGTTFYPTENTQSQSFQVWNSGEGTLNYSISTDSPWLTVNPSSGTSTGEKDSIQVNYNTTSMANGSYLAKITVSDPNATNTPGQINVTLTLNREISRTISLSGDLAFGSIPAGSSMQRPLTINNSSKSTLNVSSISYPTGFSGNWPGGAVGAGAFRLVMVTFSPTAQSTYDGTITVNSDKTAGTNTIPCSGAGTVTVTPTSTPTPTPSASPILSVTPASPPTEPATAGSVNFIVTNTGGGMLSYFASVTTGNSWLHITSGASGGNGETIVVVYDANNTEVERSGKIVVTPNDKSSSPVTLTVTQLASENSNTVDVTKWRKKKEVSSDPRSANPIVPQISYFKYSIRYHPASTLYPGRDFCK
jgi:hypothetical protein